MEKIKIQFGKAANSDMRPNVPGEGPEEEPHQEEDFEESDLISDLKTVRDLISSGDTQGALKVIDNCLSTHEGHEQSEGDPNDFEGNFDRAFQKYSEEKGPSNG